MSVRKAVFPLTVLLLTGLAGMAETPIPPEMSTTFAQAQSQVHEIEVDKRIVLSLTLLIILFGVAVGILQATEPTMRSKLATAILGATITAATAVQTTIYAGTYKAYVRAARDGKNELGEMNRCIQRYSHEPDQRNLVEIAKEFFAHHYRVNREIPDRLYTSSIPLTLPTVEAAPSADQPPEWVKKPLVPDKYTVAAIGQASHPDLTTAGKRARWRAAEQIVSQLGPYRVSERLLDVLISSGKIANSTFTFDSKRYVYTSYVLLEVNKSYAYLNVRKLPKPSAQGNADVRLGSRYQAGTVRVSAPQPLEGQFDFRFEVKTSNDRLTITLSAIDVRQDGPDDSISWLFDVLVDGRLLMLIPDRPYSDQKGKEHVPVGLTEAIYDPPLRGFRLSVYGYRRFK